MARAATASLGRREPHQPGEVLQAHTSARSGVLFGDWFGDTLLAHGHLGPTLDRFEGDGHGATSVNYSDLPHSGLPGPRLLRSGLPVSASKLAPDVGTAVPDSAGDFPLRVVRSVPLLPNGHSAIPDGARLLSRLNTAGSVVSIVLPASTARVVKSPQTVNVNYAGAVSPPCSRLRRSLRKEA